MNKIETAQSDGKWISCWEDTMEQSGVWIIDLCTSTTSTTISTHATQGEAEDAAIAEAKLRGLVFLSASESISLVE